MNPLEKAIIEIGGVGRLAAAIGVGQSTVSNWKVRGSIPAEHCAGIEAATGGLVTRRDLRPLDWQKIWPELAEAPASPAPAATETVAQGLN
jgi:DNA-binding transcriptional regulator YdaS (Cro superfamily)